MIHPSIHPLLQRYSPDLTDLGSYVNGQWVTGQGEPIEVLSAHDETVLFAYADADASLVPLLNAATKVAQAQWAALTGAERGRVMFRVAAELRQEAEHLAWIEAKTANKPIRDARGEVAKVAEMFEYYGGWADKIEGSVIPVPTTHLNYVTYEPLGTVLQITPWNAPIFTCGWQVAPALAAGNAVILKPSELTPVSSLLVAALPGMLILFGCCLVGLMVRRVVPFNIPAIAWVSMAAVVIALPVMPMADYVIEATDKLGLLPLISPALAYAGIAISQIEVKLFKRSGVKIAIVVLLTFTGTYMGSVLIADWML